jgi:single-stranded-DNA-specific exonuclease
MKWQILGKGKDIVEILLKNRGIKNKKEFFDPLDPSKIKLTSLGVSKPQIDKAIKRIKLAKSKKEEVIVYGDYDADGITATAIMWEAIHEFGLNVLPHIPDRFEEGYGINSTSVENLKLKIPNLSLIVTVDNGIVALGGIKKAKELGIDVIVIDHHTKGEKKNEALSIIHSTEVCGSALAWFFAKELKIEKGLELAAIGTIADQMPLVGVNRSLVKYGLAQLNKTKRPGLLALFEDSKIKRVGTYEVNYVIAPRINAMGRLANGLDSLRLLCTKKAEKALELSKLLTDTNIDRQKIVDVVVKHALSMSKGNIPNVIVLAHETYHEGVIGLAAGKLVEEFYRPAIVISTKGKKAKASARSIPGFNIIEAIRATGLILEGGGHPMAAGFSISTEKIGVFTKEINKLAAKLITPELLEKKLKIDMEIEFEDVTADLYKELQKFDPTGIGNPAPTFATRGAEIIKAKTVGNGAKHLKLTLKQDEHIFDAIYFGGGEIYSKLKTNTKIDAVYRIEEDTWNGLGSLQLLIRDIRL